MTETERLLTIARASCEATQAALAALALLIEPHPSINGSTGCDHHRRVSVRTMQDPTAWYCPNCQQQGTDTLHQKEG